MLPKPSVDPTSTAPAITARSRKRTKRSVSPRIASIDRCPGPRAAESTTPAAGAVVDSGSFRDDGDGDAAPATVVESNESRDRSPALVAPSVVRTPARARMAAGTATRARRSRRCATGSDWQGPHFGGLACPAQFHRTRPRVCVSRAYQARGDLAASPDGNELKMREHPVKLRALQREETWTWGIARELESGSRCCLAFEDENVQGPALPVRHEGGRDDPRRFTHTRQQARLEKLRAALDRIALSGFSNHDGLHSGSSSRRAGHRLSIRSAR